MQWKQKAPPTQLPLSDDLEDSYAEWRNAGSGAGFSEISRLFFTRLLERDLRYFLDREASSAIPDLHGRSSFSRRLSDHVDLISQHAFETSKIAQSFSAGWFSKNALGRVPSRELVANYIQYAFKKLSDELSIEEGKR